MPVAVFDLDDTLIHGDSATLWLHWLVSQGHAPRDMLDTEASMMRHYRAGSLRMEDYMAFTLQPLAGLTPDAVARWADAFIGEAIAPRVFRDAGKRLRHYAGQGWTVLIVSATGDHLVHPIARSLGVAHSLGIQLEQRQGRYTGRTQGVLTYREGKVSRLQAWLTDQGLALQGSHGYSDSINDLPLLGAVDQAFVVNPCDRLRQQASARGWAHLQWVQVLGDDSARAARPSAVEQVKAAPDSEQA